MYVHVSLFLLLLQLKMATVQENAVFVHDVSILYLSIGKVKSHSFFIWIIRLWTGH